MKEHILLIIVLLVASMCPAQSNESVRPCDRSLKFCWSDDQVEVLGIDFANGTSDDGLVGKTLAIAIRCMKKLGVCIQAEAAKGSDLAGQDVVANITVMPFMQWDKDMITLDIEGNDANPCGRTSYILDRTKQSVRLVISPGPNADSPLCAAVMGKPRTITYNLKR